MSRVMYLFVRLYTTKNHTKLKPDGNVRRGLVAPVTIDVNKANQNLQKLTNIRKA